MTFYDRLTANRYEFKNSFCSLKFIDFMNTDMSEATASDRDKDREDRVQQIIRSIFSFTRYEPGNPYVFHKVVPSARNVHPNEAFLIEDGQISRFNPKANSFERLGFNRAYKGKLWIVVASELWRIMKFYGEFGLALSLLDLGHIQAHLKLKLIAAGYDKATLIYGYSQRELAESLGFSEDSAYVGAVIDLSEYLNPHDGAFLSEEDDRMKRPIRRKFSYQNELSSYPEVIKFLRHRDKPQVRPLAYSEGAKSLCKVLKNERDRSSGHSRAGLFSTIDRLPTDTVIRYGLEIGHYIRYYLGYKSGFRVGLLYRALDGENHLILTSGAGIERIVRLGMIHRMGLLHDTFEHINMNSIPLSIIITYKRNQFNTEYTDIRDAHIGAGEISQYISLLAAGDGFFARPMKNFNDDYIA